MNSCDLLAGTFLRADEPEAEAGDTLLSARVRDLAERDRRRLLMHLLCLNEDDRRLRFGAAVDDEAITRYVQHIDFHRDALFGIQDENASLAGAGHLVFMPRDAFSDLGSVTSKERIAEFGVSVQESARRKGLGARLFERAVQRCCAEDVDLLYMPCLDDNAAAVSLARKTGFEVCLTSGRTYLKLVAEDSDIAFPAWTDFSAVSSLPPEQPPHGQ